MTALFLALVMIAVPVSRGEPQDENNKSAAPAAKTETKKETPVKAGLSINNPGAFQGYNLMSPLASSRTYLFDLQGRVVRTWDSDCSPALCPYLLDNGHVLRGGSIGVEAQVFGPGPGVGGRVQEFTWEGELVWDFRFFNARQLPHHDLTPLPNGNVMMIVWDRKMAKEALAAGRRPELNPDSHLLSDSLIEIKPTGKTTGEVVWEWHLWDHLVQDFDKSKPNYGNVAEHPELVNINYGEDALAPIAATKDGAEKLKSVGYIGANAPRPGRGSSDWTHFNSVAYNPALDQLMISTPHFSEFWIIDHSTTPKEAASHQGGRGGKGGDLLYRWGNPRAYRAGKKEDQKLFAQHNAHWIGKGLRGEGHVLVFNNGAQRPDGSYSSVDEIVLPVDSQGRYTYQPGTAFGPERSVWSYTAPKKTDFYSFFISGAQRLANGNTLICSGADGTFFEVTPEKEIVWKYTNPVKGDGMPGPGGFGPPLQPGQVMTPIVRDLLAMSPEQRNQLDDLQRAVTARLDKLLPTVQKRQLKEPLQTPSPGGFGPSFRPGELLTSAEQNRLKLSAEQKKELAELQKDVDGKLEKVLNEEQREQAKGGFAFPGGGGPPGGGPGGPPRPGQLLPSFVRDGLNLTDEQKKQLDTFQKEADQRLDKILADEQKKQLKEPQNIGSPPQPGELLSLTLQARLRLTGDQKKAVQALQSEADALVGKLFTDEQKKQFKEMQANVARGGPRGPGGGAPGPPGAPGGFPNLAVAVFRVYRFAPNHPGLAGKDLTAGKAIEEIQPKKPADKATLTNGAQREK